MRSVDLFIILTHCQYEKGGYQNRFNLGDQWYTMGVSGEGKLIRDKRYNNPSTDWRRICNRLKRHSELLKHFEEFIFTGLSMTNFAIIMKLAEMLSIKTQIKIDYATELNSTDRLIDICQHYNATTYLAGSSGSKYMEMDKFKQAGIEVEFQTPIDKRPVLEVLNEKLR